MRNILVVLALLLSISLSLGYTLPGHSVLGNIDVTNHTIVFLAYPANDTDAVNKAYVDSNLSSTYLPLSGGTMAGQIDFFGITGYNLSTPANDSDAVIKSYADAINVSAYAWTNTTNQTILDYVNTTNQTILDYVNATNQTCLDWTNSTNSSMKGYVDGINTSTYSYIDAEHLIMATSSVATEFGNASRTILPFATEVRDADGLWNGTTFTVDKDGVYLIDGSVLTTSYAGNAGDAFSASIRINASDVLVNLVYETSATQNQFHRFTMLTWLEATTTVQLVCWKVSTSWVKLDGDATHNWVTIARV